MNLVKAQTIRRAIPALAVGGVLAFSFFAASPSLASSTNNCGVKGYGYHDHGKACPDRPFPGHGFGVLAKLGSGVLTSNSHAKTTHAKVPVTFDVNVTSAVNHYSNSSSDSTAIVKSVGHG